MKTNLAVLPYRYNNISHISFKAKSQKGQEKTLPKIEVKTPKSLHPGELEGVSYYMRQKIIEGANKSSLSVDDYLRQYLKHLTYSPRVLPEPSKTAKVGRTNVTTLIDGEQIFDKTIEYVKSAEDSILIEMFEFQNLKVDWQKWPTNGSDVVPGFEQQQSLLPILIKKKKENPDLKIQIILDAHKWYINGHGQKDRHYNNQQMIRFLKENGIDVVPYPRPAQQGAALQHVKLLAVDGKKAILGGMNWGTHSCANHDACIAIETRPEYKNSEVDNIIEEVFNKDWMFSWQRLGRTKVIAGPLTEAEQEFYNGIRKEIKQENVEYMNIVGEIFDKPEYRTRYDEKDLSKLDMVETNPVENPNMHILATKPRELTFIGEEGKETTRKYIQDKLNTCSTVKAELFVLSDKELVETIIKRHNDPDDDFDAKFIVASEILEEFPYCRKAYDALVENDVPIRLYNFDERINQRMHAKWAVFDDRELLIGSTNWSAMGLNQNLKKGMREDYELHAEKINAEIRDYLFDVKEFEELLNFPPLARRKLDYAELKARRKIFKKALDDLNKIGVATVHLQGKDYYLNDDQKSTLVTIQGYYKIIKDRYNAKEKYKRGNNECAVAFDKPSIASVFVRQFNKDWKYSVTDFEKLKQKVPSYPKAPSSRMNVVV